MNEIKKCARALQRSFCSSKSTEPTYLKVAAGFFDDDSLKVQPNLVSLLSTRWKTSTTVEAQRAALFAGCLDDLMRLKGEAKTETLVRWFDESS